MSNYSFQQLEDIWIQAGGSALYASMAAAIALAESGGNPGSTNNNSNGTTDKGLWQINSIHGAQSTYDPLSNARAAVAISKNGTNWRPWCTAWSNGACGGTFMGSGSPVLKHLPSGAATGGAAVSNSSPAEGVATSTATATPVGIPGLGDVTGLGDLSNTLSQIYSAFMKTVWFGAVCGFGILLVFGGLALMGYQTRPGQAVAGAAVKAAGK